jgi:hypothetical protein
MPRAPRGVVHSRTILHVAAPQGEDKQTDEIWVVCRSIAPGDTLHTTFSLVVAPYPTSFRTMAQAWPQKLRERFDDLLHGVKNGDVLMNNAWYSNDALPVIDSLYEAAGAMTGIPQRPVDEPARNRTPRP